MRVDILFILLNELRKSDKMRGLVKHCISFSQRVKLDSTVHEQECLILFII